MKLELYLRKPCAHCGCKLGVLKLKGGQRTLRCSSCDRWQYNAPKPKKGVT
jgi:hypothetical protein